MEELVDQKIPSPKSGVFRDILLVSTCKRKAAYILVSIKVDHTLSRKGGCWNKYQQCKNNEKKLKNKSSAYFLT